MSKSDACRHRSCILDWSVPIQASLCSRAAKSGKNFHRHAQGENFPCFRFCSDISSVSATDLRETPTHRHGESRLGLPKLHRAVAAAPSVLEPKRIVGHPSVGIRPSIRNPVVVAFRPFSRLAVVVAVVLAQQPGPTRSALRVRSGIVQCNGQTS